MNIHENWLKLQLFTRECVRVLKVTRKPNRQEFNVIVKASALGMAIIGALGFAVNMIKLGLFGG